MSTEQDAVAVERVAKAICIEGLSGKILIDALNKGINVTALHRAQATAAITAHNAHLRERSRDADVVDATATAMFLATGIERHAYRAQAKPVVTAALDAMIGKEQGDE